MPKSKENEPKGHHDGGLFLVVADQTEESQAALRYAARLTKLSGGRIALLHVMDDQDFHHWGNVQEKMRYEQRENAEKLVWEMAKDVIDWSDKLPVIYIEEGDLVAKVTEVIASDKNLKRLVLASNRTPGSPGRMVQHFSNKAIHDMPIPIILVPGHLTNDEIDALL